MPRNFYIIVLVIISLISFEQVSGCVDVTANELGWVFPLSNGDLQAFGFRQNDVTGQCVLMSTKTRANGDTISTGQIINVPITFSYSDFMDIDANGNYMIGGVVDTVNEQLFRVITLANPTKIGTVKSFPIPLDSFGNAINYDWRNIHGIGCVFFGLNNKFTYSTVLLRYDGKVIYSPGSVNGIAYQRIGDVAHLAKQDHTDG